MHSRGKGGMYPWGNPAVVSFCLYSVVDILVDPRRIVQTNCLFVLYSVLYFYLSVYVTSHDKIAFACLN